MAPLTSIAFLQHPSRSLLPYDTPSRSLLPYVPYFLMTPPHVPCFIMTTAHIPYIKFKIKFECLKDPFGSIVGHCPACSTVQAYQNLSGISADRDRFHIVQLLLQKDEVLVIVDG